MQFLSEPSGGSDVAGALDHRGARRRRVGPQRLQGLDHRRLVVRLGPVPGPHQLGRPQAPRPHRCSCFPIHQAGIEVHRIEMLNGYKEFCQEFLTDVRVPDTDRVGEVDEGWTVGTRWMFHERMLCNSPLVTMPAGTMHAAAGGRVDARRRPRRRPARRPAGPRPRRRGRDARRSSPTRCEAPDRSGHRDRHDVRPGVGHRPALRRAWPRPAAPRSPSSSPAPPARRGPTTTATLGRRRQRLPHAPGRPASAAAPPRWPAT